MQGELRGRAPPGRHTLPHPSIMVSGAAPLRPVITIYRSHDRELSDWLIGIYRTE